MGSPIWQQNIFYGSISWHVTANQGVAIYTDSERTNFIGSNRLLNGIQSGDSITYSIVSGDDDGAFRISTDDKVRTTSAEAIDYETTSSYNLRIRATNSYGHSEITLEIDVEPPPILMEIPPAPLTGNTTSHSGLTNDLFNGTYSISQSYRSDTNVWGGVTYPNQQNFNPESDMFKFFDKGTTWASSWRRAQVSSTHGSGKYAFTITMPYYSCIQQMIISIDSTNLWYRVPRSKFQIWGIDGENATSLFELNTTQFTNDTGKNELLN